MKMKRIVIGLPMYGDISPANKVDAMRLMFCLGRHYADYEFFVCWRSKSEQFRARNFVIQEARKADATFLFFMDDDHIVDWGGARGNKPYMFLRTLIDHMEADSELGIVGALYYQRGGGLHKPVLMHSVIDEAGAPKGRFYNDGEIEGKLQEVDVQGGGIMLLRMKMFDKMEEPYFQPEVMEDNDSQGTDLQICRKAKKLGWKVACDTSIVIGHEFSDRMVIHSENRNLLIEDAHRSANTEVSQELDNWQKMVMGDAEGYLDRSEAQILGLGSARRYDNLHRKRFSEYKNPENYYKSIGVDQICRQLVYHRTPDLVAHDASIVNMFRGKKQLNGLDFGCGISQLGFEILKLGNFMSFVDIEGTAVSNFVKWRIKKHGLESRASYSIEGPYDFAILMDIIEHLRDWEYHLDNIVGRMNKGAALFTNMFVMRLRKDDSEHINLDFTGVQQFLTNRGFVPTHMGLWIKTDNFLGGAKNAKNNRENVDIGEGSAVGQAG